MFRLVSTKPTFLADEIRAFAEKETMQRSLLPNYSETLDLVGTAWRYVFICDPPYS